MIVAAIDPGRGGAVALYNDGMVSVTRLPKDGNYELIDALVSDICRQGTVTWVLEDVGRHFVGNHASSSVKLARHVGNLEAAILAHSGTAAHRITPEKWQKQLQPLPKGRGNYQERKRAVRDKMKVAYPDIKVTLVNGDALGILWGYLSMQNIHVPPISASGAS